MHAQVDRKQENKSKAASQIQSRLKDRDQSTFQYADNRREATSLGKLQELANNSPQAKQAAQLQAIADNHSDQHQQPIQKIENKTGLPDNLKSGIENLSGYSIDDVKVHYNSDKPAQLQAHAYAQGTDIHIASGQEKHLPHEAWHVAQQKQGRVKPTMQMKGGVNVNNDTGLENEADVMGAKALQSGNKGALQLKTKSAENSTVQRTVGEASGKETVDTKNGFLIPDTLSLENLIRGDNRERNQIASDGFKPGKTALGYFDKLKAFLDGMNDKKESESTAQIMKDREPGKAILNPEDKRHKQIDLVWSQEKIEIGNGKKITLLNYVCTGMDSGAGGNDYLINVNESFECISASPSIGLYQSASGIQILAMGLSASPGKGEYVKFHEYDFITPIPPDKIYYNSKDDGKTQSVQGGGWYNVITEKPL